MLPTHRKPNHLGKILLEEFLIPLNISQSEFALHLGGSWAQPKLNAMIHGKRSITEEIALDLADALGTSPEFWMGLQADINLWEEIAPFRGLNCFLVIYLNLSNNIHYWIDIFQFQKRRICLACQSQHFVDGKQKAS